MYRIELSPGEETAFRSIEELAVAIRRKVVTPRARIYHNATSKWLPIQFHPHYKLAVSMPLSQADLVAGPPVTPLSALKLVEPHQPAAPTAPTTPSTRAAATEAALAAWPEPKPGSPKAPEPPAPQRMEPSGRVAPNRNEAPVPEPIRAVEQPRLRLPRAVRTPRHAGPANVVEVRTAGTRRRRKLRILRVALAGATLIACAHLVASSASGPSAQASARLRTPRQLISVPAEALTSVAPRSVAAVLPALQTIPLPGLAEAASLLTSPAGVDSRSSTAAPERPVEVPTPAPSALADSAAGTDSVPELEPAPDAGPIRAGLPMRSEPLAPQVVDSTGKKAMKGILRTIGGSPAPETRSSR